MRVLALLCIALPIYAVAPAIQGVSNSANYQPVIASATWVSVFGSNLASSTRQWAGADFAGNKLPTKLDDVQVTVNNQPAYIALISPTQINILCPDDPMTGQVNVQVTNSQGTSNAFKVTKQSVAPAFFAYGVQGGKYAVAQSSSYDLIGPPGLLGATVTTLRAKPNQVLTFYTTGLGTTQPAQSAGLVVATAAPLASPVQILFGNQPAQVLYAGLIGSGLYQVNVTVPGSASGDTSVTLTTGGQTATTTVAVESSSAPSVPLNAPALVGCVSGQVDSISYLSSRLSFGQAEEVSIGGTLLCATCTVKPPIYPEFAIRLENALRRGKKVQACYDGSGQIYQLLTSQR